MKPLGIGFVGAGNIVRQRHLPGLREIEGVEIVAVSNSTLDSSEAFIRSNAREARAIEHWEELVALPEVDIVWIGTPPILHSPVTLAALTAEKHVFCQARMAMSHQEALMMLEAAQGHPDRVTALCPPPHGMKGDRFLQELLANDTVGAIRTLRLRSLNGMFLDPTRPPHWRQRRELSGANALTIGIHTEVLQRWFGPFRVTGAEGRVFVPERHGYPIRIPDQVQALAVFDNGATGLLDFSAVHSGDPVEVLEIVGSRGVLRYDFSDDSITLERKGAESSELLEIPEEKVRPWTVERDFIEAVRNPAAPRPRPNFLDGVAYMEVTQQIADLVAHQS